MTPSMTMTAILALVSLYAAYSIICSAIVEWVSALLRRRAALLEASVQQLLRGGDIYAAFVAHPLITGLLRPAHSPLPMLQSLKRWRRYPDYIPPQTFALAMMDICMTFTPAAPGVPAQIRPKTFANALDSELASALAQGTSSVGPVQQRIEDWFKESMEVISGQYKRWTQLMTIAVAAALTMMLQFDTLRIYSELSNHRMSVSHGGYTLSIIALSFGAPFWFDLLKRLVNLRQSGVPPDETRARPIL